MAPDLVVWVLLNRLESRAGQLGGIDLCENHNLHQSEHQHTRHSVATQRSVYIFVFVNLEFLNIAKEVRVSFRESKMKNQ